MKVYVGHVWRHQIVVVTNSAIFWIRILSVTRKYESQTHMLTVPYHSLTITIMYSSISLFEIEYMMIGCERILCRFQPIPRKRPTSRYSSSTKRRKRRAGWYGGLLEVESVWIPGMNLRLSCYVVNSVSSSCRDNTHNINIQNLRFSFQGIILSRLWGPRYLDFF